MTGGVVDRALQVLQEELRSGGPTFGRTAEEASLLAAVMSAGGPAAPTASTSPASALESSPTDTVQQARETLHELLDKLIDLVQARAVSRLPASPDQVLRATLKTISESFPMFRVTDLLRPGQPVRIPISLRNEGTAPTELALAITDFLGGPDQRIPGTLARLVPDVVQLAPGDTGDISVLLQIPPDAAPGLYTALLRAVGLDELQAAVAFRVAD